MKNTRCIIFLQFFLFIFLCPLFAEPRVGVVSARFDDIAHLFDKFNIPYTSLSIRDCEKYENLEKLDVLCLPCGVEPAIESSISVVARRYRIQGVTLSEEYREIQYERINENIERFLRTGKTAYFSDFSYRYLQEIASPFEFFREFPHSGMIGAADVHINGDLAAFFNETRIRFVMNHNGWVALKHAKGEVLATGKFHTPSGQKEGPICVRMGIGDGTAYYTSFHSSRWEREYMRFFVYRLGGYSLLQGIKERAATWGQKIETTVIDSFIPGEYYRTYSMHMPADKATLYIDSDKDSRFQLDIYDAEKKLIASYDPVVPGNEIVLRGSEGNKVILSVYPSGNMVHRKYILGIAGGKQLFPYLHFIKRGAIVLLVMISIIILWKSWKPQKFTGKERYWREIQK